MGEVALSMFHCTLPFLNSTKHRIPIYSVRRSQQVNTFQNKFGVYILKEYAEVGQAGEKGREENFWRSSEEPCYIVNVEPRRSLECTELMM